MSDFFPLVTFWRSWYVGILTIVGEDKNLSIQRNQFQEKIKYFPQKLDCCNFFREIDLFSFTSLFHIPAINDNIQLMKNYGFCFMEGQKYNLVKCKIKPPGLYASRRMDKRGNPNIGRLRLRIRPEDVIINCR